MTSPPRIGVSMDVEEGPDGRRARAFAYLDYFAAVVRAGGLPVALPPTDHHPRAVLEHLDGLLVTGGDDYRPRTWGGEPHPEETYVHPVREAFDLPLLRAAVESTLPFLAICGGMQAWAITQGGTIVQHIPDEPDAGDHADGEHPLEVERGSRLHAVVGDEPVVNTKHHQAVRTAGSLQVTARAPDGTVEAIEQPGGPWRLGVQWHPELLGPGAPGDGLVRALVGAAVNRDPSS